MLKRYCQLHKLSLDYKFTEEGKAHAKIYRATAVVAEEDRGKGDASKKKAAQILAALDALTQLEIDLSTLGSQGLMPNGNGGEIREQRMKREREAGAGDGEDEARDRSAVRMREWGKGEGRGEREEAWAWGLF